VIKGGAAVAAGCWVAAGGSVSMGRVLGGMKEQERMKTSERSGMSRRFISATPGRRMIYYRADWGGAAMIIYDQRYLRVVKHFSVR
jgi:hypothetical protein